MALKNEFLSNYREWDFKLLICDVLSTVPRPSPRALPKSEKRTIRKAKAKHFIIDHLNTLDIYRESRVDFDFPLFLLLLFWDAGAFECEGGEICANV